MKLVILVRKDLDMGCGKIAVQVGHASIDALIHATESYMNKFAMMKEWLDGGQHKTVLKVKDLHELRFYEDCAESHNLPHGFVYDFGLTQVEPNTITCLWIGPEENSKIDEVCGELKLL